MTEIKDFIKTVNEKIDYTNFAEEVVVLAENKSGTGYSLYTVKNKNGVTFQNVPGSPNIRDRGYMGFVNGDRGRPTVIGAGTKTTTVTTTVSSPWTEQVDIAPPYYWDIQLEVSNGAGSDTRTKTAYVKAV